MEAPSLRPLCPTRWIVKSKSFESVLMKYEAIFETRQSVMNGCDGGRSIFEFVSKASDIY